LGSGLYAWSDCPAAAEERLDPGGGGRPCGPDRIQRMLNRIDWDADEVLDDVRQYVVDNLGDPDAVLGVAAAGLDRGRPLAPPARSAPGRTARVRSAGHERLRDRRLAHQGSERGLTPSLRRSTAHGRAASIT
ncbi:LOW QUALITY PROTEIN: conserved hypothetical protein, partial [Streptomyces sp. e14]